MYKHKLWLLRSILIFSIFALACKGKKKTIKAVKSDIVESVYASATIRSTDQYMVYSTVSGILQKNLVKEGDTVLAGQIIAQLENTNPGLNADNARLALDLANKNFGNLDELKAQVANARQQFQLDSINYYRQKNLWEQNIGTQAQLEGRKLAYEASKNTLYAIRTRLRQTTLQLNAARDQAQNNLSITSRSSNDFSIQSKINGRVYELNYKPGELILPQQPFALIGNANRFMLLLEVDEVDVSRVKPGQQVLISMDAYAGKVFEAVVTRILPNMDLKTQTFQVEAEFTQKPPALYPGLSAEANIVIQKKSAAWIIPLEYLVHGDSVMTLNGLKKVRTGLRSIDKIEILDGIDGQTELKKPE